MDFYNQMFNPAFVNQQTYQQILEMQQYQFEQNKEVANAIKAMHDFCEAVNKLDDQHKQQVFAGCVFEIARANHWA